MDPYTEDLKIRISLLSKNARVLFAALTCEMLYPNYVAFEKRTGWGKSEILMEAIAFFYQKVIKDKLYSVEEIEDMINRIDSVTPDTEDFTDLSTSFALDACTSIYSTLNYLLENNLNHILDVVTYALDTVHMFVQIKEDFNSLDPGSETKIANDLFMIVEKNRQLKLIKTLTDADLSIITNELIASLRSKNPIIDLSLLPA
jgi:uncharacterized protein YjaG (DUF416 family)